MRTAVPIRTTLLAALLLALGAGGAGADTNAVATPPAAAAQGAGLQWSSDADQTLAKAKAEGRPVYIYIWAKYNPDCVYMADNTLADDAVSAQLQSFDLVALDADNRANFPFFDRYKIRYVRIEGPNAAPVPYEKGLQVTGGAMYPTNLFLDAAGREVYRMPGRVDAKGFTIVLGQVQQLLKAWANQQRNPTSPTAEAQLGHLYALLQVLPEAKKHLQKALDLDPQNQSGLYPDIKLDLIIMGIPEDPGGSLQKLQGWEKQYATHPRRLEAVYYEAVANVAVGSELIQKAPDPDAVRAVTKQAIASYDVALRILARFGQAQPKSLEYQSQWYQPALQLIAGIEQARTDLLAPPPPPPPH
jgi:tetratricopeptide (TPR) repeat protein